MGATVSQESPALTAWLAFSKATDEQMAAVARLLEIAAAAARNPEDAQRLRSGRDRLRGALHDLLLTNAMGTQRPGNASEDVVSRRKLAALMQVVHEVHGALALLDQMGEQHRRS